MIRYLDWKFNYMKSNVSRYCKSYFKFDLGNDIGTFTAD